MPDSVEVVIEKALMQRSQEFATTQGLQISLPNVDFSPPETTIDARYLRATLLPADTASLGVGSADTDQHFGFLQLDVFYGIGGGAIQPRRIAAAAISYFKRGTRITFDGFNVDILETPRLGPLVKTENWIFLPLRIPYTCFAIPA